MSQQLPDQEVGRGQVRVTGHESVAMPHHDAYATMGDMEF